MASNTDYFYEEPEKPIDYKYYFFLFLKNFTNILTFFVIAVTFAVIYASKIPDDYQAFSQVILERPRAPKADPSMAFQAPEAESLTEDYYNTESEIMRSNAVLRQVITNLKLMDYFGFPTEEETFAKIKKMIQIKRVGTSRIFNIYITANDPQLAMNMSNEIARAYVRKNFENTLYYSKEILNWLPQDGKPEDVLTIPGANGEMKQVKREELMESLPAFQTDGTLRELREKKARAESEIDLLKKQYRLKHPIMVKALANLEFINESVKIEKSRIVEDLKSQAQGQHKLANARLIEEAKLPEKPLVPKRIPIIVLIAMAELILSLIIIIIMDHFDHTVKNVEDLERKGIMIPFLGHIPLLKKKSWESEKPLAVYQKETPEMAEAFRYLRVAINFSGSPESIKTLVMSSCLPHEGKSFASHNIAISLAVDGNKTLLVDADLRRPVVHKRFRTDNAVGLSNYLTSNIEFDSIVKESFVENLSLVVSGPTSPNPMEIFGSDRMKLFIEEAKKRFDRIIIDCPPLTGIGDGYVVGSQIGQIILVIAAGTTPVDLIKQNQKQLEKAHVKIMGAILNKVDMDKERHGGYYKHYHHTYTRYYHSNEPK